MDQEHQLIDYRMFFSSYMRAKENFISAAVSFVHFKCKIRKFITSIFRKEYILHYLKDLIETVFVLFYHNL